MTICKHCGVELEKDMQICPLCETPVSNDDTLDEIAEHQSKHGTSLPFNSDFAYLTAFQKQKLFWEISTIILVSGMISTFFIDMIVHKEMTWSKYIITIGLVLLINITLFIFWRRKKVLTVCLSFLSLSTVLFLLDLFTGRISWITKLGVPVLFVFYLMLFLFVQLIKRSSSKGLNLVAYAFITIGLFTLCIEGIVAFIKSEKLILHWSPIVVVSLMPVIAILFYIHYRLQRGTDLKRFFHI